MLAPNTQDIVDPFYPDGYVSSDQDRSRIIAQKKKYAASVGSINFKFPIARGLLEVLSTFLSIDRSM